MERKIVLGAGCFWCIEAVFDTIEGIVEIQPGYAGGKSKNPTYREVCSGDSGHAEVVQLTYDDEQISLEDIFSIFFQSHDPTTLNRQGADIGSQYRSVVFYNNEDQKNAALKAISRLEEHKVFEDPIVTEVEALPRFYSAEKAHYDYYKNNPEAAYCQMVIRPKVEKIKYLFADKLV